MSARRVVPACHGSRLRCESAGVVLEVDANLGGRIVEYSLHGLDALFTGDGDGENHGSTFWTSPQSDWGWPPPAEIDRAPYTIVPKNDSIELESRRSRTLGISIGKRFEMAEDGTVVLEYRIRNPSDAAVTVAPWEVTRVPRNGASFFPRNGSLRGSSQFPAPAVVESNGLVWVDHRGGALGDRKLFASGPANWLAHAANGLLFVKTFASVPIECVAPEEAAIEVFVSGSAAYVEIEQQGAYTRIEPGDSLTWSVTWRLLEIGHEVSVPDARLVSQTRELLESGQR